MTCRPDSLTLLRITVGLFSRLMGGSFLTTTSGVNTMYTDPNRVRSKTINVRLNEFEYQKVIRFVNKSGGQLAATLRDLALMELKDIELTRKREDSQ